MKPLHQIFAWNRSSAASPAFVSNEGGEAAQKASALDKRLLERLLREEGLSQTASKRVVHNFFTTLKK